MFGCVRRLGCLVVLLVLAGAAWFGRDLWLPQARAWLAGGETAGASVADGTWESLSPDQAERGERAVRDLSRSGGPVYVSLRPGELASYVFLSLASTLPASAESAEAAVIGDRVYLRAVVALAELGGVGGLGSLGGLLAERDTLRLGGTFDVVRPGLAQFNVREVRLGGFPVPERVIPSLVSRVRRGTAPEGIAADALPVRIPEYIGDVRVARGRITLYKNSR